MLRHKRQVSGSREMSKKNLIGSIMPKYNSWLKNKKHEKKEPVNQPLIKRSAKHRVKTAVDIDAEFDAIYHGQKQTVHLGDILSKGYDECEEIVKGFLMKYTNNSEDIPLYVSKDISWPNAAVKIGTKRGLLEIAITEKNVSVEKTPFITLAEEENPVVKIMDAPYDIVGWQRVLPVCLKIYGEKNETAFSNSISGFVDNIGKLAQKTGGSYRLVNEIDNERLEDTVQQIMKQNILVKEPTVNYLKEIWKEACERYGSEEAAAEFFGIRAQYMMQYNKSGHVRNKDSVKMLKKKMQAEGTNKKSEMDENRFRIYTNDIRTLEMGTEFFLREYVYGKIIEDLVSSTFESIKPFEELYDNKLRYTSP